MAYPNYNPYQPYSPYPQSSYPQPQQQASFSCRPVTSREEALAVQTDFMSAGTILPDLAHGILLEGVDLFAILVINGVAALPRRESVFINAIRADLRSSIAPRFADAVHLPHFLRQFHRLFRLFCRRRDQHLRGYIVPQLGKVIPHAEAVPQMFGIDMVGIG